MSESFGLFADHDYRFGASSKFAPSGVVTVREAASQLKTLLDSLNFLIGGNRSVNRNFCSNHWLLMIRSLLPFQLTIRIFSAIDYQEKFCGLLDVKRVEWIGKTCEIS